ncbi:tafazzin [Cucumis melo var. makuwa]|uniref:Tafazzin n=2 Tax=Cucumis melo TaxID=3656 RepID=A0A5A7U4X8_CUCMM|nr:tafazzin [Cucumis melo var. makuwa]
MVNFAFVVFISHNVKVKISDESDRKTGVSYTDTHAIKTSSLPAAFFFPSPIKPPSHPPFHLLLSYNLPSFFSDSSHLNSMALNLIDRTDLWKNKARSLQLRLRDRFRVAVDNHRRKPTIFSDGYFSFTLRLWLQRFRDFRHDLPSSTVFYRKRVGKDFNDGEESAVLRMLQAVAVPVLGNVCHVFMHGLNRVQVYGLEKLHKAVLQRPKDQPLVTVSNHVASVDDPFVIAALLPPSVLFDAQNLRWTLCATDRCFNNSVTSAFFSTVKVLPVARGDGIYQKGMDVAISKLNHGGWVHIFPEGSRSRDGGKTMGSSKRGIGRLILDADTVPTVIPFVHTGMQEIMPIGAKIPRIGKTVTILIGDPIEFEDLLNSESEQKFSRGNLYDAVASRVGNRLLDMKLQVEKLANDRALDMQNHSMSGTERAAIMLQQIDWESFGIGSFTSVDYNSPTKQETQTQFDLDVPSEQQPISDWNFRMRLSREGGFISRMRGYIDPTEFMSFAARGLFRNHKTLGNSELDKANRPLKAWKRFVEANVMKRGSGTPTNIASYNNLTVLMR